jgi:hypothetical protein
VLYQLSYYQRRGSWTRTSGLLVPNQAFYQLKYTPIKLSDQGSNLDLPESKSGVLPIKLSDNKKPDLWGRVSDCAE